MRCVTHNTIEHFAYCLHFLRPRGTRKIVLRNLHNTRPYNNYVELSNRADLFTKSKSEEKLDRKILLFFQRNSLSWKLRDGSKR